MNAQYTQPDTPPQPEEAAEDGWTFQRVVILATAGFIFIVFLPFIGALIISLTTDVQRAAEVMRSLRDVSIIIVALVGVTVVVSLAVLVLQVAQLIHLLRSDVRPILDDLQTTASMTRDTAKFMGDNVARPVIRAGAFGAGLKVFITELGGIRKAIRRNPKPSASAQPEKDESAHV